MLTVFLIFLSFDQHFFVVADAAHKGIDNEKDGKSNKSVQKNADVKVENEQIDDIKTRLRRENKVVDGDSRQRQESKSDTENDSERTSGGSTVMTTLQLIRAVEGFRGLNLEQLERLQPSKRKMLLEALAEVKDYEASAENDKTIAEGSKVNTENHEDLAVKKVGASIFVKRSNKIMMFGAVLNLIGVFLKHSRTLNLSNYDPERNYIHEYILFISTVCYEFGMGLILRMELNEWAEMEYTPGAKWSTANGVALVIGTLFKTMGVFLSGLKPTVAVFLPGVNNAVSGYAYAVEGAKYSLIGNGINLVLSMGERAIDIVNNIPRLLRNTRFIANLALFIAAIASNVGVYIAAFTCSRKKAKEGDCVPLPDYVRTKTYPAVQIGSALLLIAGNVLHQMPCKECGE